MLSPDPRSPAPSPPGDQFHTTRWSVVLAAAHESSAEAEGALAELCTTYWFPLYAYVRRRGYGPHDAEDLTQGFFARLLRLQSLTRVDQERGLFRAFLLASLKHYLADEWDRSHAERRSEAKTRSASDLHPFDAEEAERRYHHVAVNPITPEHLYERQWAITLLEHVLQRLQEEYAASERSPLFEAIRFAITGDKAALPYAELAARLGCQEGSVRIEVHRLRVRYRHLLRAEIAQTVETQAEVDEELRALRRILSPLSG